METWEMFYCERWDLQSAWPPCRQKCLLKAWQIESLLGEIDLVCRHQKRILWYEYSPLYNLDGSCLIAALVTRSVSNCPQPAHHALMSWQILSQPLWSQYHTSGHCIEYTELDAKYFDTRYLVKQVIIMTTAHSIDAKDLQRHKASLIAVAHF